VNAIGVSEERPGASSASVEIIGIGDELLDGDVLDTNTHWLCRRITRLGGRVQRAVLVRDEVEAVVREVQAAIARQVSLLMTTGGLGPTDDDRTLAAIAKATSRDLAESADAVRLVAATFQRLAQSHAIDEATLSPERRKMASIPRGAVPLFNPNGAAPGVLLKIQGTTLVCLPGVPAELRGIVEESLRGTLENLLGAGVFLEKLAIVRCKDESILAPLLRHVSERNPSIYVKSHAERFGQAVAFRVTLSARGRSSDQLRSQVDRALRDLKHVLDEVGLVIESVEDIA
jgi:nicotinamide-nucleotide amidase